jgi:Concanavalin A-like lectin/glucanases superfamily
LSETDSGLLLIESNNKILQEKLDKETVSTETSNSTGADPVLNLDLPTSIEETAVAREMEFMVVRPVIHFNNPQSHLQLSPQRDVQVSWTVEFWLKREEPPVPCVETVQPVVPKGYAAAVTDGLPPLSPKGDKRPLRGLLGLGNRPVGMLPVGATPESIQTSISKLSQMLGSDFGVVGTGQSVWGWGDNGSQGGVEAGMSDAFDGLEGRRAGGGGGGSGGESTWTLIPPTAGILDPIDGMSFEPDPDGTNTVPSGLLAEAFQTQSDSETFGDPSLEPVVPADDKDTELAGKALRDLLDNICELESLQTTPNVKTVLPQDGTGRDPEDSTPSLPPPGLTPSSEGFSLSTGRAPKHFSSARTSSSGTSGVKKFLLPLFPHPEEKSKKENKVAIPELKCEAKENIIPPIYLLSSSGGHIKMQMGGRVFSGDDFADPNQASNPVHNQAYCLSIGQRGANEKSFDYVVPTGSWVHIAISCSVGVASSGSGSVVSLYANGELKDSQNTRCNLPIGTIGCNKKGQSFAGQFCDMRIWSCARSAAEIRRDMHTDVSGIYRL